MHLGSALRKIRKAKKLQVKYLAIESKQPNGWVSMTEFAIHPRKKSMDLYCKTLNMPVAAVLLHAINESEIPQDHLEAFQKLKQDIIK